MTFGDMSRRANRRRSHHSSHVESQTAFRRPSQVYRDDWRYDAIILRSQPEFLRRRQTPYVFIQIVELSHIAHSTV